MIIESDPVRMAEQQAKIRTALHVIMHSFFDECDFFFPDIESVPFLKYLSSIQNVSSNIS